MLTAANDSTPCVMWHISVRFQGWWMAKAFFKANGRFHFLNEYRYLIPPCRPTWVIFYNYPKLKSICFLHQNVNLVLLCYKYPNLKEMVSFFLSSAFKITAHQWSVTAILRDKNQCQWSFWPVILSMLYINDFCYILYSKFHVKLLIQFFYLLHSFIQLS